MTDDTPLPFKKPAPPAALELPGKPYLQQDETLDRLVKMTNQTNLIALDKTLAALRRAEKSQGPAYAPAAVRVSSIAERIVRAAREVRLCIPQDQRKF